MNLRYTRKALGHLLEIHAYSEQEWPGISRQVGKAIEHAISRLLQYPELGRPGRVEGTRELIVPRFSFVVAYRVSESHINVLAILHATRRWPSSF